MFVHDVTKEPPAAQPPEKIFRHESDVKSAPACGAKTKKSGGETLRRTVRCLVFLSCSVAGAADASALCALRCAERPSRNSAAGSTSKFPWCFRSECFDRDRGLPKRKPSSWPQTSVGAGNGADNGVYLREDSVEPVRLAASSEKTCRDFGSRLRNSPREGDGERDKCPAASRRLKTSGIQSQGTAAATPGP